MSEEEIEQLTSIFLKLAVWYLETPAALLEENKELSDTVAEWIKFSAARLAVQHAKAK